MLHIGIHIQFDITYFYQSITVSISGEAISLAKEKRKDNSKLITNYKTPEIATISR